MGVDAGARNQLVWSRSPILRESSFMLVHGQPICGRGDVFSWLEAAACASAEGLSASRPRCALLLPRRTSVLEVLPREHLYNNPAY